MVLFTVFVQKPKDYRLPLNHFTDCYNVHIIWYDAAQRTSRMQAVCTVHTYPIYFITSVTISNSFFMDIYTYTVSTIVHAAMSPISNEDLAQKHNSEQLLWKYSWITAHSTISLQDLPKPVIFTMRTLYTWSRPYKGIYGMTQFDYLSSKVHVYWKPTSFKQPSKLENEVIVTNWQLKVSYTPFDQI